nr:sister-chromatid cohesion protein 3 [Tanacetum cinerariifolium]
MVSGCREGWRRLGDGDDGERGSVGCGDEGGGVMGCAMMLVDRWWVRWRIGAVLAQSSQPLVGLMRNMRSIILIYYARRKKKYADSMVNGKLVDVSENNEAMELPLFSLSTIANACGAKFRIQGEFLDETNVDDVVVALVNMAAP